MTLRALGEGRATFFLAAFFGAERGDAALRCGRALFLAIRDSSMVESVWDAGLATARKIT